MLTACSNMKHSTHRLTLVAALSVNILVADLSSADAPPVIYEINASQTQTQWIFGDIVQQNNYSNVGPSPSWTSSLTYTEAAPGFLSGPVGEFTGSTAINIDVTNTALNESTLEIGHTTGLTYRHDGGWPYFITKVADSVSLNIYLLGAPGTPYELDITLSADTPISYSERASGSSVAYTSPGLAWNWPSVDGDLNGFSTSLSGVTNATTIVFSGETYSQIQLGIEFATSAEFGNTGPSQAPFLFGAGIGLNETLVVRNLSVIPEPHSALLVVFGAGALFWHRRRLSMTRK